MRNRVIVACLFLLLATSARAQDQGRGYLSLNFGVQPPAEETLADAVVFPYREELATFGAGYPIERSFAFDIGGGGFVLPWLGAGVAVSRTSDSGPATIVASVPHPFLFNRSATDEGQTEDDYQHAETGVHLNAIVRLPTGPRANVLFFGGPSFIRVKQDLVSDISYDELLIPGTYAVSLTGVRRDTISSTATGYNVGADFGLFLTDRLGVGGLVRYARATYELPSRLGETVGALDLSALLQKPKAGGLFVAGGVRLKF
jgi:hypothetical protein